MRKTRHRVIAHIVLIVFVFGQTVCVRGQDQTRPQFDSAKAGAMLADYFDFVHATRAGLDRSVFDVAAKAKQLGSAAAAYFFVKNEIRYEEYAGSLRGARGTLESGAGNSIDQSLLLLELIRSLGGEAWLVSGSLSKEKRDKLTRQMFGPGRAFQLPDAGPAPTEQQLGDLARVFAIDPNRLATSLDAQVTDAAVLRSTLSRIVQNTSEVLRQSLELVGTHPQNAIAAPSELPHVWVQFRDAAGRIINLDPSFRDSIYGQAYAAAAVNWTELPPELYQQVRISLIIEALTEKGELEKDILWRIDLSGVKITTTDIQFEIIPDRLDLEALQAGRFNNDVLLGDVDRNESFQPRFKVGGKVVAYRPYNI